MNDLKTNKIEMNLLHLKQMKINKKISDKLVNLILQTKKKQKNKKNKK